MTKKLKKEPVAAPRDDIEAERWIFEIGTAQRQVARIEADLADAVAKLKVLYEAQAKPLQEYIEKAVSGLEVYARENRARLTQDGATKTIRLPTGEMCWRERPPSVRIKDEDAVLAALQERQLGKFIREKLSVDRAAMLREPTLAMTVPGVSIGSPGEDFIVTPAAAQLAAAE